MINIWARNGSTFKMGEVSNQEKHLPIGIFKICTTPMGELFLELTDEKYGFPYKVYGHEKDLIKRVVRTYKHTKSNLGVLLNGIKGTGKTVTCELICNELKMPTLLIDRDYENLVEFLSNIQQDICLFFDEFEKVFPTDYRTGSKLLSVMDGALKNEHRKVFLLTTNELRIEPNLVQRPGRIRYVKTFKNLSKACIEEIIDDKLKNKEFREETLKFISQLELITIDIVTSIVSEVNIHDETPENFVNIFNVKKLSEVFDIYEVDQENEDINSEKKICERTKVNCHPDNLREYEGCNFMAGTRDLGIIQSVEGDDLFTTIKGKTVKQYRIVPRWSVNSLFY